MGGSLEYSELAGVIKNREVYANIINFVGTGTYKGDTTLMAAKYYKHIYTTEIVPTLYHEAVSKAKNNNITNINFYLGDSVKLLNEIVPKVTGGAVFFIDAHQSGPDTSNNGQWVPLLEELTVILKHTIGPSIFIIDDLRFFDNGASKPWDWAHISPNTILTLFQTFNYKVKESYTSNDRFYILTE